MSQNRDYYQGRYKISFCADGWACIDRVTGQREHTAPTKAEAVDWAKAKSFKPRTGNA